MAERNFGAPPTRSPVLIGAVVAAVLVVGAALVVVAPFAFGRQAASEKPAQPAQAASPAAVPSSAPAAAASAPPIPSARAGVFNNRGQEPVSGDATIDRTANGGLVLRLTNLNSTPGPNLWVYLSRVDSPSNDGQVKNGLEVGKLTATRGDLSYDLDASLDTTQFRSVVVYCKTYNVVFGFANLR